MERIEKVIEIDASIERVFHLFSDFENFPRWMRHIRDVHYSGRRYTRWTADAPLGTSVEWEAETIAFDPPYLIAWRSVRGDVDTEGEVSFRETRRGTTMLHVILGYRPPAGRLGALVASLFGSDPEQQLEEDLERFAQVAEGRRRQRQRRESSRSAEARPRQREFYDSRTRDAGDDDARYNRRDDRARDERRLDFDEEWDERLGQLPSRRESQNTEERAEWRHAMTPRERERERRERRDDSGYSGETLRRGVDRLMDEPPSRRYRRWD
ncbi:MAG TPA: SRPBCC family protein [Pyrinomonadaceae bacterium]|nr:SRPBCC family protein [Pyrinomonadaceae bacterium]